MGSYNEVRVAYLYVPLRRGPSTEGDEMASTSGSDHKGFLATCAAKITVIFYSISDARFGTHALDDPFFVCRRHFRSPVYPE